MKKSEFRKRFLDMPNIKVICCYLVIMLFGCGKQNDINYPDDLSINFHSCVDTYFVDRPVVCRLLFNTPPADMKFLWDFGDGNTSDEPMPSHSYSTTGTYTISLEVNYGRKTKNYEETIEVEPSPKFVPSGTGDKFGRFIYQDEIGNYHIVFNNYTNSSASDWYSLQFNNNMVVSERKDFDFEIYEAITDAFINTDGNIACLTNNRFLIYGNDDQVANFHDLSRTWSPFNFMNAEEVNDKYYIAGSKSDQYKILEINNVGEKINEREYDALIEGFSLTFIKQFGTEILLAYVEEPGTDDSKSIIRKVSNLGDLIWEREYDFVIGEEIDKVSDGFIVNHKKLRFDDTKLLDITKIDSNGSPQWTNTIDWKPFLTNDISWGNPEVYTFEVDSGLLLFLNNMRCVRINHQGIIMLDKCYGFGGFKTEVLGHVTKNANGNFVMLGTSYSVKDTEKLDLIVIEINEEGEIVE